MQLDGDLAFEVLRRPFASSRLFACCIFVYALRHPAQRRLLPQCLTVCSVSEAMHDWGLWSCSEEQSGSPQLVLDIPPELHGIAHAFIATAHGSLGAFHIDHYVLHSRYLHVERRF